MLLAATVAVCALSCSRHEGPAVADGPPQKIPHWEVESPDEIFSLLRGMVVVDRSGELGFDACTLYGADGESGTFWTTPPDDLQQWMLVEFPAKSGRELLPSWQYCHV